MTLGQAKIGEEVVISAVNGEQSFRRRLLELGLLPGTRVSIVRVAPLGDPIELSARNTRLSIRRKEAEGILVDRGESPRSPT